jgi:glutamate formiminotransferase
MSIGTYGERDTVSNAIGYAKDHSRAHDAVIHVYDAARKLIEVDRHKGDFKAW